MALQLRKLSKAVMRSRRISPHLPPHWQLPLRMRPYFILLTVLTLITMALLGFTEFARALPINDKILHFLCFAIATALFYFIFDVEEEARRIWYWRHAGILATGFACFFCGGILSEFVQGMSPYRTFQFGDIVANLLGCSLGLYISWHLEKYYRHRREIARLYRPLHSGLGLSTAIDDDSDSDSENDATGGTQLLPMHRPSNKVTKPNAGPVRLGDVWNTREEIFGIGDSDDDDDTLADVGRHPQTPVPKITITGV